MENFIQSIPEDKKTNVNLLKNLIAAGKKELDSLQEEFITKSLIDRSQVLPLNTNTEVLKSLIYMENFKTDCITNYHEYVLKSNQIRNQLNHFSYLLEKEIIDHYIFSQTDIIIEHLKKLLLEQK